MTGRFQTALAAAAIGLGSLAAPAAHADDVSKAIGNIAKSYLSAEQDKAAFAQAQQVNSASAYRQYLAQFPNGAYVSYARDRVIALEGAGGARVPGVRPVQPQTQAQAQGNAKGEVGYGRSAAVAELQLQLSRDDRARIQRNLTAMGYNTNGSDGIFGSGSRRAIASWQQANGLQATGFLNAREAQAILARSGAAPQSGRSAAAGDRPMVEERLIGMNSAERAEMQTRLTMLGYNTKGTDGNFGATTRSMIARWQGDNGFAQTGYFTADQVDRLRRQGRR